MAKLLGIIFIALFIIAFVGTIIKHMQNRKNKPRAVGRKPKTKRKVKHKDHGEHKGHKDHHEHS